MERGNWISPNSAKNEGFDAFNKIWCFSYYSVYCKYMSKLSNFFSFLLQVYLHQLHTYFIFKGRNGFDRNLHFKKGGFYRCPFCFNLLRITNASVFGLQTSWNRAESGCWQVFQTWLKSGQGNWTHILHNWMLCIGNVVMKWLPTVPPPKYSPAITWWQVQLVERFPGEWTNHRYFSFGHFSSRNGTRWRVDFVGKSQLSVDFALCSSSWSFCQLVASTLVVVLVMLKLLGPPSLFLLSLEIS